jgi:hypothetical protein
MPSDGLENSCPPAYLSFPPFVASLPLPLPLSISLSLSRPRLLDPHLMYVSAARASRRCVSTYQSPLGRMSFGEGLKAPWCVWCCVGANDLRPFICQPLNITIFWGREVFFGRGACCQFFLSHSTRMAYVLVVGSWIMSRMYACSFLSCVLLPR